MILQLKDVMDCIESYYNCGITSYESNWDDETRVVTINLRTKKSEKEKILEKINKIVRLVEDDFVVIGDDCYAVFKVFFDGSIRMEMRLKETDFNLFDKIKDYEECKYSDLKNGDIFIAVDDINSLESSNVNFHYSKCDYYLNSLGYITETSCYYGRNNLKVIKLL